MKLLLKGALLLDTDRLFVREDVLVEDGIIRAVGHDLGDADAEYDLSGKTLMPGVIDAHVHVAVDNAGFSDEALRCWAQNGVTTVRELGMLCVRSAEEFAAWLGEHQTCEHARVIKAGKYIDVSNGYGCGPDPNYTVGIIIETPEQAADAVTYQHKLGSDGIKIGINDSINPFLPPEAAGANMQRMSGDIARAIIERAHSHGMWVAAHLTRAATVEELLGYGLDDAAHVPKDEMSDELVERCVKAGLMFTTTIGDPDGELPPFPPEMLDKLRSLIAVERSIVLKNLMKIYKAGGTIAVGTDLIHASDLSKAAAVPVAEMRQLRESGMSFHDVIRSATINAAKVCHIDDEEGSIAVGKRANLIAVEGRPDDSFETLKDVKFVLNRGQVIKRL